MQRYMVAIFNDRESAEEAVDALRSSTAPIEEISILAGRHHQCSLIQKMGMVDTPMVTASNMENQERNRGATEVGMKAGAEVGAVVGFLAGLALVVATGGGLALLVAGPIAAAMGGGVTGAAAGGVTGALIGLGIAREQAQEIENRLRDGAIVVSFRTDERNVAAAEDLLCAYRPQEVIITALAGAVA